MRLKSIELQGFKSFVDRTRLEFDEGITAILGPNGCGKSNVVDAVRWVLGEQSAKQLRGGKMDDVIFKGTTKRRPVGIAEVTLTFDNEDRGLPIDFGEVAVKRKVSRDGGSDYFLNGQLCRLKDLRDLFYDSGVNNTAYSIIEESMIKQILNENNDELLNLLEEGSGITKYKARRKETQRKLERTQSDLVRLYDIIEEIGTEVRSLQRQVGKARRHQKLFKEIRALELLIGGARRRELDRQESEARDSLQEFRTQAEAGVGELAELQARLDAARPELEEREAERRQLEEAMRAFEDELQETERQVLVLEHRIDEHQRRIQDNTGAIKEAEVRQQEIEAQIQRMIEHLQTIEEELASSATMLAERTESLQVLEDRLARDRASLDEASRRNLEFIENDATQRSRLRELQVKQENRQERMAVLTGDRERLLQDGREAEAGLQTFAASKSEAQQRRAGLLTDLAGLEKGEHDLEDQASVLQQEAAALGGRREAARSTRDLLQRLQDQYEGYGQGPREVLRRHAGEDRIHGGLADLLRVSEADKAALEILLFELVDSVVVDSDATAAGLVGELRAERIGRASFLCSDGFDAPVAPLPRIPADGRLAAEVITGRGAELPALRRLLARTVIFAEDQAAAEAARTWNHPETLLCVSRGGVLFSSDGQVRGGRQQGQDAGLLGRKEKLEELQQEIVRLDGKVEAVREKLARNKAEREDLREQLIDGRGRLSALDAELGALEVQAAQLVHRRDTADRLAREMAAERERLEGETAALAADQQRLGDVLSESGRQRLDSTTHRDELRQRVAEAELSRDDARSQTEELRLTHQRRQGQKRETETALVHLRENVAEQFSRRERLAQESEVSRESMAALAEELQTKRNLLAKGMGERERRRQVVRAAADGIQALHEQTARWHDRLQAIEKQRGGFRDQAHQMETLLATLDIKRNNLEERLEQQYNAGFADLVASLDEEDLPRELEREQGVFQIDQAEALLGDRREKIGSLGPINHLALEEYETKKERLEFLEHQRDDVQKARDDLQKAIGEINRTARKRFLETFEEVRRNYIAVFQTLFSGGRADLQLVRTDDPLESQIHVTAQPTGKVVDTVALLSGGERCLTALSLLFAVYLVKPSPFCMLDEADAPLDDANIGRFVNMLKEFSKGTQFLVITHNKLTMETANHLYGVTMMEPGVSSIVSVSFHDVALTQNDLDLGNAIARRRREIDSVAARNPLLAAADEPVAADEQDELAAADEPVAADEQDEQTLEASE